DHDRRKHGARRAARLTVGSSGRRVAHHIRKNLAPPATPGVARRLTMSTPIDFTNVSTRGVESSPVDAALAGLRANEARYFKNKYDHVFTVEPASNAQAAIDWVHRILREERDIIIASRPLEATAFEVEG